MRISTTGMYDESVKNIQERRDQLTQSQLQASTGKRILTPSDDPAGSAYALELQQLESKNTQYAENSKTAGDSLSLLETSIENVIGVLQDIRSNAIQAGTGTLTASDRQAISKNIDGAFEQLLSIANTTDSNGDYVFAGGSSRTKPFVETTPGKVSYNGDQTQRSIQISSSRQIPISESGFSMFQQVQTGNGVFIVSPSSDNTGNATVDIGSVVDPKQVTGHAYTVSFLKIGTDMTYSVLDATTGNAVSSAQPFVGSPSTIEFDGISFQVKGTPDSGDKLSVDASPIQSLFTTIDQLRTTLAAPQDTAAQRASFQSTFGQVMANIDQTIGHLTDKQTTIGAYRKEAETTKNFAEDLDVLYKGQLADIQDIDPVKAISSVTQQQTYLEIAMKTFSQLQSLSLFDFIR